jgi:hypothetical protein
MILALARIVNYDSRIIIYNYIILATVIMILNYDRTVITIINYNPKSFIVQATELITATIFMTIVRGPILNYICCHYSSVKIN